jgi:hypothetical protein
MMPRTVSYDDFQREWRPRLLLTKARLGLRRPPDTKQRNPEERRTLIMLDCVRVRKLFVSGQRAWTGPRSIRVSI